MAIIQMQKYKVTRALKVQFCLKLFFFIVVLAWTLSKTALSAAQLSFILFVCFLVVFFFYLLGYHKTLSFERRALLWLGNACVLTALVLLAVFLKGFF